MSRASNKIALLAAGMLLSACTVGPNFRPPAPPGTQSYTAAHDTPAPKGAPLMDTDKPMPSAWWQEFRSPPLDASMQEAFAHSPDLASAEATLAAARENVNATRGALFPQVQLNGSVARQKYGAALFGPSNFKIPPFTYYEIGPSLSYVLDYTGGLRRGVERDRALAEFQGYERDAAYLTLSGNLTMQALAMASARAELAAVTQVIAEDEKNLKLVQARFTAGAGTRTDILSAQSQLANDRAELPALHQSLDTARHAVAILAGHAPGDWNPPEFALADFHAPDTLPLSLPSELVHRRPDIMAAEAQLHAASASIGVATAALYPNITLTANTMQEALTPAQLFSLKSNAFAVAGNLTAPIFNGGTLQAKRRQAVDDYKAAEANYEKTVLQAFGQVADALQAIRNGTADVRDQREALRIAAANVDIARKSFAAGNSGILQVLDAERQRSQAQLGLSRAQAKLLTSEAQLYLALGGGAQLGG